MTIYEFIVLFPDETSCRLHFKSVREEKGITCKKCKGKSHYWLPKKWQWQCNNCPFRTTLRSGTFMQWAKLSFHKWYLCMALMSATKKGISAMEMKRQLGHKRYRTIWELMQKIRVSMGDRDNMLHIDEVVESDLKKFNNQRKTTRHRKAKILVAHMESRTDDPGFQNLMYADPEGERLTNTIEWIGDKRSLNPGFHFFYNTYMSFENKISNHKGQNWMSIINGNARRNILGVYHKVSTKYLQRYLSEFCFRLNRRDLNERRFDSLIWAVASNFCGTLPTIQKNSWSNST